MTTEAEPADRPAATRRRQRPQRATSEELVRAALRVIARDGVAGATTRKIADEAGVPLGTVHYWFADKNELLEEVVREVVRRLETAVTATGMPHGGTLDDVRDGLNAAWSEVVQDDPGAQLALYELTALAVRTSEMRRLARLQYSAYRDLAARSLAPVLAGLDEHRAALVAELVSVTFDGLCLAWLADPDGSHPAEIFDLLAELLGPLLPTGEPQPANEATAPPRSDP